MSHIATTWAYRQAIDAGPKFVLVALADFADENGSCYPGQDRLATMTGTHRSTVVRHLKTLEDLGLITRAHRQGRNGQRTSDRYTLDLAANVAESNVGNTNVAESNVASKGGHCRNLHEPTSQSATVTVREPSVEPSGGPRRRGTRIPDTFRPTPEYIAWAIENAPDVDIDHETAQFADHFQAQPGQKGVKLDWQATWRTWIRRQQKWADERKATTGLTSATADAIWGGGAA